MHVVYHVFQSAIALQAPRVYNDSDRVTCMESRLFFAFSTFINITNAIH